MFEHDELGDVDKLLKQMVVPPQNKKAVPFEFHMLSSIHRAQRFFNKTAEMGVKLGVPFGRQIKIPYPQTKQLPLTNTLPDLHTKRQDELEIFSGLLYYNACSGLTHFNYFFKDDGARGEYAESLAALEAHRDILVEQDAIAARVRSHESYDLDMDTQVRLTFLFLYMPPTQPTP
jgi:hypothetical protein